MKFLGIDLGWQQGASGLCCLGVTPTGLQLLDLTSRPSHDQVLAWVDTHTADGQPALIAVDAPTLIPNATGMRLPDRLAHRYFGRYDAGCYPANQGRPFAIPLLQFSAALEIRGFAHAPNLTPQRPGRYQVELFPHPATVHLFRLSKILKYKKGRLAERRPELMKLRQYQLQTFPQLTPALPIRSTDLPPVPTTGKAMKAVEDRLDSLTCAYAGAHWWWWGRDRNWVLGDVTTGFIVVPAPFPDQVMPLDPDNPQN
jgi:predicted RNase H-like nuclease